MDPHYKNRWVRLCNGLWPIVQKRVNAEALALCKDKSKLLVEAEGLDARIDRVSAKIFFDAEKLIVLRDPLGAVGGASLDLASVKGNHEVGDRGILGLAAAVADDGGIAGVLGHLDRIDGFGEGANLVQFDENGVGGAEIDALLNVLGIGDEEVIADELDFVAEFFGELDPAIPIGFA